MWGKAETEDRLSWISIGEFVVTAVIRVIAVYCLERDVLILGVSTPTQRWISVLKVNENVAPAKRHRHWIFH